MIDKDKMKEIKNMPVSEALNCKCGKTNGQEARERDVRGRDVRERGRSMRFYEEASTSDKLIFNLRYVSHAMRTSFEDKAGQKRVLILLSEQDSLTQRELTELLGVRPGSASEILSKLENAGLITRAQNEFDRRTIDVRLTEAGTAMALESAQKRSKWSEEMFSCLTDEEQETLLSLLEKIHSDWEERYPGRHGHKGPHFPHGPHGECGHHGPFGPRGPHGECGHHGPFGPRGPHGECGHHGPFGPRGPHGECGHHGPFGPRGPHGECGPHGPFGPHWEGPCGRQPEDDR